MREKTSGELGTLLGQYEAVGGVVEHVLLQKDRNHTLAFECHRAAAVCTLDVLAARTDAYFEELIRYAPQEERDRDKYFRVVSDTNKISGRQITLSEFVGPYFDLEQRRLIVRGRESLNAYFYVGDAELPANALTRRRPGAAGLTNGYAQAFSEPPYRLNASAQQISELFLALAKELFCNFRCELLIYQWSTDWSNYFDAGHEWWGSFLWTIEPPGADYIVGVAASSTD